MLTEVDRRAFHDLALRYASAVDRRDYAKLPELLAHDALISAHPGDPRTAEPLFELRGHPSILEGMARIEAYRVTFHHVGGQYVEADGADTAAGETLCTAHHVYERDGRDFDRTMHLRYQDRFRREDGIWRFSERRLWVVFESDRPLDAEGSRS